MDMSENEQPIIRPADLALSTPLEQLECLVIKTSRENCLVRFYPALYQITLECEGREEKIILGYSGARLLERLVQNPGEVVSREDLLTHAWTDRVVGQGSLNQQIYMLRQLLDDEKDREIIQTLPRRGYMINPQFVVRVSEPSRAEPASSLATTDAQAQLLKGLATAKNSTAPAAPTPIPSTEQTPAAQADKSAAPGTNNHSSVRLPSQAPGNKPWFNWGLGAFGALGLVIGALGLFNGSPSDAPLRQTRVVYGTDPAASQAQLQRAAAQVIASIKRLHPQPLEVFVTQHQQVLHVICKSEDGLAHSLHLNLAEAQTPSDELLAQCLP